MRQRRAIASLHGVLVVSEVCGQLDLQPVRVRVGVIEFEQISIVHLVDQTNGEG